MLFLKTPVAAERLGVSYWRLMGLLRSRKITPPNRDSSGDFIWLEADLDRARQAMGLDATDGREAARA
ncbi:MAG: hypothetical protein JNM56_33030 [Planctomycetia bacterium]|nr:hypothetical protein [Planctomycetia bacterium]